MKINIIFIIFSCIFLFTSTIIQAQYCIPSVTSTPIDTGITNVTFDIINNTSPAGQGYVDFSNVDTATLIMGGLVNLSITVPTKSILRGFIDFNQDNILNPLEALIFANLNPGVNDVTFMIPRYAPPLRLTGYTRLRLVVGSDFVFNSCGPFPNGDIEDYTVNLIETQIILDSVITKQANPCCFRVGEVRKDVIGIELHTSGTLDSLILNNITFNTSGTTNMADITKAELWYVGISETYASNSNADPSLMHRKLIGSINNPVAGNFTITSDFSFSQMFTPTVHYFWLSYDIAPTASLGNTIDVGCVNLTIDSLGSISVITPNLGTPAGNYTIKDQSNFYGSRKANHWYFGGNAGIDFNCDPPKAVTEGRLSAAESVTSISDDQGKLLFYSDGVMVYNPIHDTMDNGTGLKGHQLGGNGAIAVPKPGSNTEYYLFVGEQGCDTMWYNIIDMSLNGGLGAVVLKNQFFSDKACEQKIAIHHCNNEDVWIIFIKDEPNFTFSKLYAFLITSTGISAPVISDLPPGVFLNYSVQGNNVASPNGRMLAFKNYESFYIVDFDNSSGIVCDLFEIPVEPNEHVIGLAFSSDNSKIYASSRLKRAPVYQFDLNAGNQADIIASKMLVHESSDSFVRNHILQNGPDGKIYVIGGGSEQYYIDIIATPNELAPACNYQPDALYLAGRGNSGNATLPKFVESYFLDPNWNPPLIKANFDYSAVCFGDTTTFTNTSTYYSDCPPEWTWTFGNPASGLADTSNLKNPKHLYTKPGLYTARLIVQEYCDLDTIIKTVLVLSDTTYILPDISICDGETIIIGIDSTTTGVTYFWSPPTGISSTTTSFTSASPDSTTTYNLIVSNTVCEDTIIQRVLVNPLPAANAGEDTSICEETTIQLLATGGNSYNWTPITGLNNPNIPDPLVTFGNTILYYVNVIDTNSGCSSTDSIEITLLPILQMNLGTDTFICPGNFIKLSNTGIDNFDRYVWSTGEETSSISISETGEYWLIVYQGSCKRSDTIKIEEECLVIFIPNIFSPNNDGNNDDFKIQGEGFKLVSLQIYGRWGNKVFDGNASNDTWIPTKENSGVYVYRYEIVRNDNGSLIEGKGNVTLVK